MKLLSTAALLGSSQAMMYVNRQDQHDHAAEAQHYVKKINWITERRLVPELVSHDEVESDEEDPNYKGFYWMERPHVNFWLDFTNPTLIQFRQHSNKYQSARNMLADSRMAYGAKKSADSREVIRSERYHQYQTQEEERFTRPTRSHLLRRMASIENMIQYKTTDYSHKKPFGAYFDYGCHCFPGSFIDPKRSPHAQPQDAIDRACQEHSWAYDCAKDDYGNDCRGKYQLYKWSGTVDDDGISTSVECLDEENTCAWAVCQIDKQLAYELAELAVGYQDRYFAGEGGTFDRRAVCEHTEMQVVDREDHNNDHHVRVASPVQTFSAPAPPAMVADDASNGWGDMNLGTVEISQPDDASSPVAAPGGMSRGSASASEDAPSYNVTPDGNNWDAPSPFLFVDGQAQDEPNWAQIKLDERKNWANFGWEVPDVEYTPPQQNNNYMNPFMGFNNGPSGFNDEPIIASPIVDPAPFDHTNAASPNDDDLDGHLEEVVTRAPTPVDLPDNPLLADDASEPEVQESASPVGDNSAAASNGQTPVEAALNAAPATEAPAPVLKNAGTFNHQKCCGEYPRRYKYSSSRQGCCIENVGPYANHWGYLYSPSRGKCCVKTVDSYRGTGSVTYTRYANNNEDCEEMLAPHNRR